MSSFGAFRHRNYRFFFAGHLTSLSGTWMQRVAQAWLVYQLTGSSLALGVVSFAGGLPTVLFSLFAGALADRFEKRRILVICQTVAMIQAFVLATLTLMEKVTYWHLVVLGALLGVADSFDTPTRQSFIKEMVGEKDLMSAIALNSSAFNTARLIGPALAGILIYKVGIGICFLINAFSFLAVIAAYLLIKLPPRFDKAESNAFESIKEGLQYVRSHKIVTTAMSLIAIASICTFSYPTLLPVFTDKVLSGKAGVYAALMTSIGAGALVTAILIAMIGNIRKKGQVATRGTILFPLALWLLSFMKSPTGAYVCCFIAGSTMISLTAVMNTLVQSAIDDNYRGRVMSLYVLLFLGPLPFGSLIAGRLAESIGVVNTIRLGATVSIVSSLLVLNRNREFIRFES